MNTLSSRPAIRTAPSFSSATPVWLALASVALFIANLVARLPGQGNNDTSVQLRQALAGVYDDWHPPVMAAVWHGMMQVLGNSESLLPMLLLQMTLHWLGFFLIARWLATQGQQRSAWVALAMGAFPLFLYYNGMVVKDVAMASALIAAVGLLLHAQTQASAGKRVLLQLGGVVLVCYGGLTRGNAVFAAGALLIAAFATDLSRRTFAFMSAAVLLAAALIPLSGFFNHQVLHARESHPIQSLMIFDLAGISRHVRSPSPLAVDGRMQAEDVERCYTPYWWDTLSPWGACADERHLVGLPPNSADVSSQAAAELGRRWRTAIADHPLAYVQHRLKHFNSSLYFIVPSWHYSHAKHPELQDRSGTASEMKKDYVKKPFLFWPITWMAILLSLIMLSWGKASNRGEQMAVAVAISGLFYGGAYLVVGVATDVRYYYWSMMAALAAAVLLAPRVQAEWRARRTRTLQMAVIPTAAVVAAGYASRLANIEAFVR